MTTSNNSHDSGELITPASAGNHDPSQTFDISLTPEEVQFIQAEFAHVDLKPAPFFINRSGEAVMRHMDEELDHTYTLIDRKKAEVRVSAGLSFDQVADAIMRLSHAEIRYHIQKNQAMLESYSPHNAEVAAKLHGDLDVTAADKLQHPEDVLLDRALEGCASPDELLHLLRVAPGEIGAIEFAKQTHGGANLQERRQMLSKLIRLFRATTSSFQLVQSAPEYHLSWVSNGNDLNHPPTGLGILRKQVFAVVSSLDPTNPRPVELVQRDLVLVHTPFDKSQIPIFTALGEVLQRPHVRVQLTSGRKLPFVLLREIESHGSGSDQISQWQGLEDRVSSGLAASALLPEIGVYPILTSVYGRQTHPQAA